MGGGSHRGVRVSFCGIILLQGQSRLRSFRELSHMASESDSLHINSNACDVKST